MGQSYATGVYEYVDELLEDREGTPFSATLERKYTRRFLVYVRDRTMSSIVACQAPGVPLPFSVYQSGNGVEFDTLCLCTELSAKQDRDDSTRWVVTASYSTVMPQGGPQSPSKVGQPNKRDGSGNNPEQEPPELEWDFEVAHKAKARDLDGGAFTNSSNQPFNPAPTVEVAYPVLVMSRNELGFDRKKAASYAFALNSDTFLGALPGTAQCLPPKAKASFKGTTAYWRVSYRIRFREEPETPGVVDPATQDTWQLKLLDQGTKVLEVDANGVVQAVPVIEPGGGFAHHPVLLDGAGHKLVPVVGLRGAPAKVLPAFRDFRVYRSKSFKDLLSKGLS